MNNSELAEMKEDRLANFAVAAYLGSLLMGQAWGMWEGSQRTTKLLVFTVPDYSGLVIFTFMASFFALSLFLATASMVMPLQRWGLSATRSVAPFMLPIVSVSFILSWLSSTLELPSDQWWAAVLFVGGFVMFLFIGFRRTLTSLFRFVRQRVRLITGNRPVANAEPDSRTNGEHSSPPERVAFRERIRILRGYFRLPQSGEFWIVLTVAILVVEVLLVIPLWDWLAEDESASATIRNIGLVIAGSLAIPLAVWRAVVADKQASSALHQTTIAQKSLLNERYQKATGMLGHDNLSVRFGGVYALQALIDEFPEQYYVSCMRSLCAFVRNPPADPQLPKFSDRELTRWGGGIRLRADVQAVMDMMRRRNDRLIALERNVEFIVDFSGADLRGSNLQAVNFTGVDLRDADLSGAYARGANLSHAYLWGARLYKTMLALANLSNASFDGADVSRTWFCVKALPDLFSDSRVRRFTASAFGISERNFYRARAKKGAPPIFGGVVLDETGAPLVWDPLKGMGVEYVSK